MTGTGIWSAGRPPSPPAEQGESAPFFRGPFAVRGVEWVHNLPRDQTSNRLVGNPRNEIEFAREALPRATTNHHHSLLYVVCLMDSRRVCDVLCLHGLRSLYPIAQSRPNKVGAIEILTHLKIPLFTFLRIGAESFSIRLL